MAVQMDIGYHRDINHIGKYIKYIFFSLPKMVIINMGREKIRINLIVLEVSK